MSDGEPFLITERLELWRPTRADEPAMFAIISDPVTGRHLGPAANRADHFMRFQRGGGSWFLHGYGNLIVRRKGRPEPIGNCGVFHSYRGLGEDLDDKAEAMWVVAAEHTGQGIAREAMTAVLAWFDRTHGPREIVCMIEPDNAPSIRLAGKLGFAATRTATMPDGAAIRLFSRASESVPARL